MNIGKLIIFCFLLILLSDFNFAFRIKCTIYHIENNELLEGIFVSVQSNTSVFISGQSDDKGIILFDDIDGGKYSIIAKAPGYYDEKLEVNLDKNFSCRIYLKPKVYNLGFYEVVGEKEKAVGSKYTFIKKDRQRAMTTLFRIPDTGP